MTFFFGQLTAPRASVDILYGVSMTLMGNCRVACEHAIKAVAISPVSAVVIGRHACITVGKFGICQVYASHRGIFASSK